MPAAGLALALRMAALGLSAGAGAPETLPATVVHETLTVVERGSDPRADVPAAVTVLTREEAAAVPAENLAELVDLLPGLQILFPAGFGAAPMLVARGFFGAGEAEYVQLRVDGVPVADPESGLVDWRRIPAGQVERIEALRGAASALYGDTALAGILDVSTRPSATGAGSDGRASLSTGSFGSVAADASWRWAAGPWDGRVVAAGARTDGFRRFADSEEGSAEAAVGGPLGGRGRSFRLVAGGSRRTRGEPGPLTAAAFAEDPESADPRFRFDEDDSDRTRAALTLELGVARPLRVAVHGSQRDGHAIRTLLLTPELADRAARDLETDSLGGSVEGELGREGDAGPVRLRWGVEAGRDTLDTSYFPVDEPGLRGAEAARAGARRERLGAFATQVWQATPRLRLVGGLRWDRVEDRERGGGADPRRHEAWSPRVGLTFRLPGEAAPATAWLQASHAFKTATLDQLFDPRPFPDFAGGTFAISNPDLSPQRARTLEAGLQRETASHRWEIAAYRTTVEDEIDFDPATFRYKNLGESLHTGVEAAGRWRRGSAFSPHLSYAWTRVEARLGENRGRQLKNVPRHLLRAGVTARLPAGLGADLRATRIAGRHLDDAGRFPLADATVLDLRLRRAFRRVQAHLDLLNLTGERYAALGFALADFSGEQVPLYFPAAGFAARVGLEVGF